MPPSDEDLLSRYAEENSEDAFAALVGRHLNLVYSVARRVVRSPQSAEDVAQAVFIDLARNARTIKPGTPLVAWLHLVSRRTAVDAVRRESRRQAREAKAAILSDAADMKPPASPWTAVEPLLDEAVESLDATDRTAILLRYFENKSLREVGAALGTSDDTAQKRVSRAVEHLRAFFLRRGVPVTAGVLAADLSAHAILSAPAALGGSITAAVLVGVSTVAVPIAAITLVQKILCGAVTAALIGVIAYNAISRSTPPTGIPALAQVPTPETSAVPAAPVAPARPVTSAARVTPGSPEDLRVALLRQLFTDLPAQSLPELRLLTPADWTEIARAHELDSAADIRVALADLRAVARKKFAASLQEALRRFTAASDGQLPTDIAQLAPYLSAPADAEMLARYELARTGKLGDPSEMLLREKRTSDMILSVGLDGWHLKNNSDLPAAFGETDADTLDRAWRVLGTALGGETMEKMATMVSPRSMRELVESVSPQLEAIFGGTDSFGDALKSATKNFISAHPGESIADLGQILPFLKDSEKFVAAIRPAFAQFEYLSEHDGKPPADPSQLLPYLERPFNPAEALRALKLTWDGEHLTLTYNWGTK